MATQAHMRQLRDAVEGALNDREKAERYELRQRAVRRGRGLGERAARPVESDQRGFPVPQPMTGFLKRVGRLLRGSARE
jgi:hypothetical protein